MFGKFEWINRWIVPCVFFCALCFVLAGNVESAGVANRQEMMKRQRQMQMQQQQQQQIVQQQRAYQQAMQQKALQQRAMQEQVIQRQKVMQQQAVHQSVNQQRALQQQQVQAYQQAVQQKATREYQHSVQRMNQQTQMQAAAMQQQNLQQAAVEQQAFNQVFAQTQQGMSAPSMSLPAFPPTEEPDAIVDISDVWDEMEVTSRIWQQLMDVEPKELTVARMIDLYGKEGVRITKPPAHYVQMIDGMAGDNPAMLDNSFKNIMRVMAVIEYDFNNGIDKDAMAKQILGEQGYQQNLQRLGKGM